MTAVSALGDFRGAASGGLYYYSYPHGCVLNIRNSWIIKTHFPWNLQKLGPSEGCRFMPLCGEQVCQRNKVLTSFQRVRYTVAGLYQTLFSLESAIKCLKTKSPTLGFQWEVPRLSLQGIDLFPVWPELFKTHIPWTVIWEISKLKYSFQIFTILSSASGIVAEFSKLKMETDFQISLWPFMQFVCIFNSWSPYSGDHQLRFWHIDQKNKTPVMNYFTKVKVILFIKPFQDYFFNAMNLRQANNGLYLCSGKYGVVFSSWPSCVWVCNTFTYNHWKKPMLMKCSWSRATQNVKGWMAHCCCASRYSLFTWLHAIFQLVLCCAIPLLPAWSLRCLGSAGGNLRTWGEYFYYFPGTSLLAQEDCLFVL